MVQKKGREARPASNPSRGRETEAALPHVVWQDKDALWVVGGRDALPSNPIVRAVIEDIAQAPRSLLSDLDYLTHQGERLRAALDPSVPEEQQKEARALLRGIRERVAQVAGVDMADPLTRTSSNPEVARKVRRVEEALQRLMGVESGGMPPEVNGVQSEFKLYDPQDPNTKEFRRELQKRLKIIQGVLDVNPHRANDIGWLSERITEIENMRAIPAQQRRIILDRLYRRVDFLEQNRIGLPRKVTRGEEEEAALHREKMISAKKRLQEKIDRVTQAQPGAAAIEDEDLQRIYLTVDQSGLTADDVRQKLGELSDLLSQRKPDGSYRVQGSDREIASEISQVLTTKERLLKFAEDIIPNVSNEDLKRYFAHLNYSEHEANWVLYTMASPQQLLERISAAAGGYGEIERKIIGLFNRMFEDADANPAEAFENYFSVFYHKPVYDAFMNRLRRAWLEGLRHPEMIVQRVVDGRVHDIKLGEALRELYERLKAEFGIREYTHNVYHILRARGELKSLAGYSNKLSSEDVDLVFAQDTKLQSAYRLFEKVITHELGWNEWEIDPTWFQETVGKGDIISRRVEELLRAEYKHVNSGRGLDDWEISRAVSIARGSVFGITAIALDRLGEADPPRGRFGYVGYLGDRLLSLWNPTRHFYYRWWGETHKFVRLVYTEIKNRGSWREVWDRKNLVRWMSKYKNQVLTNLRQYDDEIMPLIHISNLAGVGGILTRAGWRYRGMIDHLIQGPRLPDHNLNYEAFTVEDWINTYRNLRQAGSNFLYFWAEELDENIRKKNVGLWNRINQTVRAAGEPDAIVTKQKVFQCIRDKNPLYFVNFDNTPLRDENGKYIPNGFSQTIRGRALQAMGGGWSRKTARDEQVDQLEHNVMLVADSIVRLRKAFWDDEVTKEVSSFLSEQELTDARAYWHSLINVINSNNMAVIEDFARRRIPYTLGSEDMDFREVRFTQGGQSMVARSLNDANLLAEKVVQPLFNLHYMLEQLGSTGDFKAFDDYLEGAKQGIDAVHGLDKFYEFSYRVNILILRYIQKSWWGRLPLAIGTLAHLSERVSMSQVNQGLHAFVGDEQVLAARINQLVKKGFLPPHEKDPDRPGVVNKYHGDKLRSEVGARPGQVLWDASRSVVPLILFFISVAAATKQVEEEKS